MEEDVIKALEILRPESGRHGMPSVPTTGLATLRLDGFVSVEAEGFMEGTLTTRPYHWNAKALHVNVHACGGTGSAGGTGGTGGWP